MHRLLLCVFAAALLGQAQGPEIDTDRPDFTDSTSIVPRGTIQAEMGLTLDHEGDAREFTVPELLLRLGLMDRLELRLGSDGFVADRPDGNPWTGGRADVEVGLKLSLWRQHGRIPAFSLLPSVSVPSGSGGFSSGSYDAQVKALWKAELPAGFELGNNLVYSALSTGTGHRLQQAYTASLGHSLPGGFDGFWEVYTVTQWEPGHNAWIADTGVTHGAGSNAQWDFRVGRRIGVAGPDWVVGAGFAFRRSLTGRTRQPKAFRFRPPA